MQTLWSLLATLLAAAGLLLGLERANLPRPQRHRQLWSPVLAFVLTASILYALFRTSAPWGREWAQLVEGAEVLLARFRIRAAEALSLGINLLLLALYLLVKRVTNAGMRMADRWLGEWGVLPAYLDDPDQGVVLRHEWVYPGMLFRTAGWAVGGGFLLLTVFSAVVHPVPLLALPQLPALAAILLLEAGWYLDGVRPVERAGEVRGRGVMHGRTGDYTALWEEYQRLWPDHVLAASSAVRLAPSPAAPAPRPRLPDEGDEVQQAATAVWHDLVAAGHPLTDVHHHVLEQLWRGRDVLLADADYAAVAPVLFAFLHKVLVDGHTALVLVPSARREDPRACGEVEAWLREGMHGGVAGGAAWGVCGFDLFAQRGATPDVLVAAPDELLGRGVAQEPWFGRLHAVVILEGDHAVFEAPMHTDALLRVLRRRRGTLQQVVLAGGREALESALRDNLAAQPVEYRPPRPAPESAFAIVWSLEALQGADAGSLARFQDRVLIGAGGADLGAEAVLALPAWRDGVTPIDLVQQEGLPWAEYVEEVENARAGLLPPVPAGGLSGSAHEALRIPALPHLLPRRERAFVLARDRDRNLVAALRAWLPLGTESAFVHVVAPPYLLRDYLAANLEFFAQAPPLALSPRLAESRFVVAVTCLERLTAAPLTEAELLGELRAVAPDARHVEDVLPRLFREVLGIDPVQLNLLTIQREARFDGKRGAFGEVVTYRLAPEIKGYPALEWLRRYRIVDRGEHPLGWIDLDRLYQTYLPGQVHAFGGKPFQVERVDHASGIVWVDHESLEQHPAYHPARTVSLQDVRPSEARAHRERRTGAGWEVDAALCRGTFRVRTGGYYAFGRDISLAPGGFAFTELDEEQVPERAYPDGRMLRLRLTAPAKLDAPTRARITDTLAILFQEAFPTLFPETHGFLLACAPGSAERWAGDPVQALMPLMGADPAPAESGAPGAEGGEKSEPVVLYFLEDAHAPLGLVLALFDRRADVLALLEDYLSWVLEDETRAGETWRRPEANRGRYLSFGWDGAYPALYLEGTHAVLRRILHGRNPRRDARRAWIGGGRGVLAAAGGTRQCDFCGRMMAAAEVHRLEDGRERCAPCTATAVDTVPALKKVYGEARQFLVHHLGEKVRRDVEVEFGGTAEVQAAGGRPFMPTAEWDVRSLGVAKRDGNRFSIIVENGQPYHSLLATIVHELTHIWQFSYLDYERMKEEHGLLLIEGHAQWAALTCLRRRGLAPEWVALEESRADVYGHGLRLIEEYERRHAHLGDVFDILLRLYPAR